MEKAYPLGEKGEQNLRELVKTIKHSGENKEYDCVVGVSGGRDSTYTLFNAVKLGLRPLAVHFDNGWNSEIAVNNIKNATNVLNVDLHTVVADWEEFKDLQKAFLWASVPDAEVPTDYVIISVLYQSAREFGVKYILNGHSFRTEGASPQGWTYMDGRYIRSVHKKFGTGKITTFPVMSMLELVNYTLFKGIRTINLLEYMDYRHSEAEKILKKEVGWEYYGGHHHESLYTHFFQSYLCPKKFNIDKRKTEFSALIRSGQITRETALQKMKEPYPYEEESVNYTLSKLGLTEDQFQQILSAEVKSFRDYPTYYPVIRICRVPIMIACKIKLLPQVFYQKFFE